MTNLDRLPRVAAHAHLEDGRLIFILRGQRSYLEKESIGVTDDDMTADAWNEEHGVSKAEAEAMLVGSVYGWDVPSANPDNWNTDATAFQWPGFPGAAAAFAARKDPPIEYTCYRTACCSYYNEEWRKAAFLCPKCAWIGTHDEMSGPNLFRELMDFECPRCEKMLLIIDYPTYEETCEAAENGNWFARYELGVMSGEGEHWEDYKRRVEESNRRLRESWLKFDGPKKYYVKTSEGYTQVDNDAAAKLVAAHAHPEPGGTS